MKAMILAGGHGMRLAEETQWKPKPLVEIGGRPIIWHVMKILAHNGVTDFIVCLGHKGHLIKEYFHNYFLHQSDLTIDLARNNVVFHRSRAEPWTISLVDTGLDTMTGGRVKRAAGHLGEDAEFLLTYADTLCDVDIRNLVEFRRRAGTLATVTTTRVADRFGRISIENETVTRFEEKPTSNHDWINAGYFVLSRHALDYIDGDSTVWEREPVGRLVREGQLSAFRHGGFWACMDTLEDRRALEHLWSTGGAPWSSW